MDKITEAKLADFIKNRAIKSLSIIQNQEGKFQIIAKLTWKEGDHELVTTRGTPRNWASLDRLARHITENYGDTQNVPICLTLLSKPQT